MRSQVLWNGSSSCVVVLDFGVARLASPVGEVWLIVRNKFGLVLRAEESLFIHHLVLHLNFVVLILLSFAEEALLNSLTLG